jgi:hypothetical protein
MTPDTSFCKHSAFLARTVPVDQRIAKLSLPAAWNSPETARQSSAALQIITALQRTMK